MSPVSVYVARFVTRNLPGVYRGLRGVLGGTTMQLGDRNQLFSMPACMAMASIVPSKACGDVRCMSEKIMPDLSICGVFLDRGITPSGRTR